MRTSTRPLRGFALETVRVMLVLLLTAIGMALTAIALERVVMDAPTAWWLCVGYAAFLLAPLLLAGRVPGGAYLGAFSFAGAAVTTVLMVLAWLWTYLYIPLRDDKGNPYYPPELLTERHLRLEAAGLELIAVFLALIVCGMFYLRSTGQHASSQPGGSTGAAHSAYRPRLPRYP